MKNDKNNDPVLFKMFDSSVQIAEQREIYDGRIDMGGLPDSFLGVTVTDVRRNDL